MYYDANFHTQSVKKECNVECRGRSCFFILCLCLDETGSHKQFILKVVFELWINCKLETWSAVSQWETVDIFVKMINCHISYFSSFIQLFVPFRHVPEFCYLHKKRSIFWTSWVDQQCLPWWKRAWKKRLLRSAKRSLTAHTVKHWMVSTARPHQFKLRFFNLLGILRLFFSCFRICVFSCLLSAMLCSLFC